MDRGTFWFMMAILGLAFVGVAIEWFYRKIEGNPAETEKEKHRALMKEIRNHDRESTSDKDRFP